MLDINDFLTDRGGDPSKIKASQTKRHAPPSAVDEVIALFQDHRSTQYQAGTVLKGEVKKIQAAIGKKKKAGEDADEELAQKVELEKQIKEKEGEAAEKKKALERKAKSIGNYVHESVPVSGTEDDNEVVKHWAPEGRKIEKEDCLSHHEVLLRLAGYDPERGVKITGHRGYCLTGPGVALNQALIQYGLEFLGDAGYLPIQPPYFMNRESMAKTAQLEQFDEELYHVSTGNPEEDKYLIATSEQPLSCLHEGEWLQEKDLPIEYAGYSTCFRKEAGSHGKDAWGIFRVHQFEKIEQFVFCNPDSSWTHFDRMIALSESFYQSLGLPYRIVSIVSGALNNAAAKKYDLEAWFPFQGEYKELVSCSNCTDYQTRELEVRYGPKTQMDKDSGRKRYCHALNATLCATERALCCIMENYQGVDAEGREGFTVPEVLRKYLPRRYGDFIPYSKELPKDSTSTKAKQGLKAKEPPTKVKQPPERAPREGVSGAGVEQAADGVKDMKV